MSEYIEVHWTCSTLEEAQKNCRTLVEKKLVACAQIIPHMESFYLWKGQIENSREVKVVLKTRRARFDQIKIFILENGSYDVPEVTYTEIVGGNKAYLDWISENTK